MVVSNHYTSTHPDSWFTKLPILIRRDPDAIRSILGRSYSVVRPGHVKERRVLTDAEFAAALTDEFGLTLTPDEIATLVAAPTAAPTLIRPAHRRRPRLQPRTSCRTPAWSR